MIESTGLYTDLESRSKAFGIAGEKRAAEILARAGFVVFFSPAHPDHGYDLIVYPNIPVEVKTSTLRTVNQRGAGFQFNLYKAGRSKPITETIVILLCDPPDRDPVPFIIPAEVIAGKHLITIPGSNPWAYKFKWAPFRAAFDRLRLAGATQYRRGRVLGADQFDRFMAEDPHAA